MKKLELFRNKLFTEKAPNRHGFKRDVELVELQNDPYPSESHSSSKFSRHDRNRNRNHNCDSFCASKQAGANLNPTDLPNQNQNRSCGSYPTNPNLEEDDDDLDNNYLSDLENSELCFSQLNSNPGILNNANPASTASSKFNNWKQKLNFKAISTLTFNFPSTHHRHSDLNGFSKLPTSERRNSSQNQHQREKRSGKNLECPSNLSETNRNFLIPPEPENIYKSTTTLASYLSQEDLFPKSDIGIGTGAGAGSGSAGGTGNESTDADMRRYREEMTESHPLRGGGDDPWSGEQGGSNNGSIRNSVQKLPWTIFFSALAASVLIFFGVVAIVLRVNTGDKDSLIDSISDSILPGAGGLDSGNIPNILKLKQVPPNLRSSALSSTEEDFQTLMDSKWPLQDVRGKDENRFRQLLSLGPSVNPHPIPIIIPIPLFKEADPNVVAEGLKAAEASKKLRDKTEQTLIQLGFTLKSGSPASTYSIATGWTSEEAQGRAVAGFMMDIASQNIAQKLNLTKSEARDGIVIQNITNFEPHEFCPSSATSIIPCDETNLYRTYDGSCNNLRHDRWGASQEPYRRILLPDYADGITKPRVASDGTALPNPRTISTLILKNDTSDDPLATFMLVLWGQFVDHDITFTAQSTGFNGTAIGCCKDGKLVKSQHPECLPITIPNNDAFYKSVKQSCINMVRSAPAPICEFGPREQFNQITSYLDASSLYGSTLNESIAVVGRFPTAPPGRLPHSYIHDGRPLLPRSVDLNDGCNSPQRVDQDQFCFKSGDKRVNENLGITSLNLIWFRQHNLLAEHLAALNPDWDGTRLFEECRRIVIAQIQHITYNEFLPILIGPGLLEAAGIKLLPSGYYTDYDQQVEATVSNAFGSSAGRVLSSMLQGVVKMVGPRWKNEDIIQIHKLFYNPYRLYELGRVDALFRGYASFPAGRADLHFSPQVTDHYFQLVNNTYGLDLAAMDIQRGRDHGLPGYTAWRQICNLTAVNNFTDLIGIWEEDDIQRVEAVYTSVEDIDLFIGGLGESSLPDAMVGPTFACILADQFLRLRKGDRFWYEGNIQLKPFTPQQLEVIRQTSLARVLCSNSDDLEIILPLVMQRESKLNPKQPCFNSDKIPELDYHPWKEETSFFLFKAEPGSQLQSQQESNPNLKLNLSKSNITNGKSNENLTDSLESTLFSEEEEEERFEKEREKDSYKSGKDSNDEDDFKTSERFFNISQYKKAGDSNTILTFTPPPKITAAATKTATTTTTVAATTVKTTAEQTKATSPKLNLNSTPVNKQEPEPPALTPNSTSDENNQNQNSENLEFHQSKKGILLEWKVKRSVDDAGSRYHKAHAALPEQMHF